MKSLKKILDIPIPYAIVIAVTAIILIVLTAQGQISIAAVIGIALIAALIVANIHLGSVVIKSVLASIAVVYSAAIYTDAVMSLHGKIIEPFLLTIAAVTLFLAQTYDSKRLNFGLRSRQLWSAVLAFVLTSFKLAFILSGYSFLITEVIGLNIIVIYILLWRLWIRNSKKTRISMPTITKEEVIGKFKFIYIENKLDAANYKWIGKDEKDSNAYPYIYNEALKADEEGLSLVLVSNLSTDKFYDVKEIEINKSKVVLFMYIEAKENTYIHDALEGFAEEIQRRSKH